MIKTQVKFLFQSGSAAADFLFRSPLRRTHQPGAGMTYRNMNSLYAVGNPPLRKYGTAGSHPAENPTLMLIPSPGE